VKRRLPLLLLGAVALLYVVVLVGAPAPINWSPDYRATSSMPLGNDVLFGMLPEWLAPPGGAPVAVRPVDDPPYELLGQPRGDTTYLFIAHEFAPDPAETARLLAHARGGATVFVATSLLTGALADSLAPPGARKMDDLRIHGVTVEWMGMEESAADSTLYLSAPGLTRSAGYRFPIAVSNQVLEGLDPARTTVISSRSDGLPIVARVPVGRGAVILSSQPDAFSNAALVGTGEAGPNDAAAWVAGVLSYVHAGPVLWDERYKPGRGEGGGPLRYVIGHPALRWAFAFLLLGVVAYALFRARRWQRPIPVIVPPPNASVEFVRTLGRLYFQHGDHAALIERKARYFTDRLRTRLGLTDASLSEETERRAVRRGIPEDVAADAFSRLRALRGRPAVPPDVLIALDRALDRFFKAAG